MGVLAEERVHQTSTLAKFLEIRLDRHTKAILEIHAVKEVIAIHAHHVVPIPNKPSCILGVMNRHDRVYWVVDFAMMVGLSPLDANTTTYELLTLADERIPIALAVRQIFGIVKLDPTEIEPSFTGSPTHLKTYTKGHLTNEQGITYLLKPEAIARSAILRS